MLFGFALRKPVEPLERLELLRAEDLFDPVGEHLVDDRVAVRFVEVGDIRATVHALRTQGHDRLTVGNQRDFLDAVHVVDVHHLLGQDLGLALERGAFEGDLLAVDEVLVTAGRTAHHLVGGATTLVPDHHVDARIEQLGHVVVVDLQHLETFPALVVDDHRVFFDAGHQLGLAFARLTRLAFGFISLALGAHLALGRVQLGPDHVLLRGEAGVGAEQLGDLLLEDHRLHGVHATVQDEDVVVADDLHFLRLALERDGGEQHLVLPGPALRADDDETVVGRLDQVVEELERLVLLVDVPEAAVAAVGHVQVGVRGHVAPVLPAVLGGAEQGNDHLASLDLEGDLAGLALVGRRLVLEDEFRDHARRLGGRGVGVRLGADALVLLDVDQGVLHHDFTAEVLAQVADDGVLGFLHLRVGGGRLEAGLREPGSLHERLLPETHQGVVLEGVPFVGVPFVGVQVDHRELALRAVLVGTVLQVEVHGGLVAARERVRSGQASDEGLLVGALPRVLLDVPGRTGRTASLVLLGLDGPLVVRDGLGGGLPLRDRLGRTLAVATLVAVAFVAGFGLGHVILLVS